MHITIKRRVQWWASPYFTMSKWHYGIHFTITRRVQWCKHARIFRVLTWFLLGVYSATMSENSYAKKHYDDSTNLQMIQIPYCDTGRTLHRQAEAAVYTTLQFSYGRGGGWMVVLSGPTRHTCCDALVKKCGSIAINRCFLL